MQKEIQEKFKNVFIEAKNKIMSDLCVKELFNEALETQKGDDVDQAALSLNQQLSLKLKGRESYFLKKIDEALDRIEEGSFGHCADCEKEISIKRLNARPTASLCISCKEEQEREEDQVLYVKRSHTLGREIKNNNVKNINFETRVSDDTMKAAEEISKSQAI